MPFHLWHRPHSVTSYGYAAGPRPLLFISWAGLYGSACVAAHALQAEPGAVSTTCVVAPMVWCVGCVMPSKVSATRARSIGVEKQPIRAGAQLHESNHDTVWLDESAGHGCRFVYSGVAFVECVGRAKLF